MQQNKCRAAVLSAAEHIDIKYVDIPQIGKDDVLVRTKACILCGSDLHGYLGRHPRVVYPRILGHEFSGVIARLGQNVSGFSEGQPVFCDIDISCGVCDYCREGRVNLCTNIKTIGFDEDGACAEYARVPKANIHPIPATMTFEAAALMNNFALAHNAVKRKGEVAEKDKVLIIGCGPVGLCSLITAKAAGAAVFIAGNHDYQLELARHFGADEVINAKKEDTVSRVLQITHGKGADKVIEIVGGVQDVTLGQCTQAVRRAGLIVLVGTFSGNRATLRAAEFKDRELEMRGSRSYIGSEAIPDVIRFIRSGAVDVTELISHRLNLEEVEHGLRLMQTRKENVMKVVISPQADY